MLSEDIKTLIRLAALVGCLISMPILFVADGKLCRYMDDFHKTNEVPTWRRILYIASFIAVVCSLCGLILADWSMLGG